MKKYIIIFVCLIVALGGYVAYAKSKNKTVNNDHTAMGHDSVDQSHRSYNVEVTSAIDDMEPGQPTRLSYKIVNDKGETLKDFTVAHEKIMHLIVVRKDLQGFQHLHPDFNKSTGEFSINITFPTDGPYRIYPDFTPTPDNPQKLTVTVNEDINVGDVSKYKAQALVADTITSKSVDGYKVDYSFPGQLKAQTPIDYNLVVEKGDEQVVLESYLGAMGHGVIIKEGTLDFIHTHAEGMDAEGMHMSANEHAGHQGEPDTIDFSTVFPEPGTYKIFTQFQVNGKVVTTDYIVKVN